MKRNKRRVVLRGQILTGTYNGLENRIQVFDGKYTTGYKVVQFDIAPDDPQGSSEYISKLSTEPKSNLAEWDWNDVQEFGWAAFNTPIASRFGYYSKLSEDNMIVEDFYISAYTTGEAGQMNYYIVLEGYDFPAWTGAGILVENLSQAGPQ